MRARRHLVPWALSLAFLTSCGGGGAPALSDPMGLGTTCQVDSQCTSSHCDTTTADRGLGVPGLCCASGTCCRTAADCPDDFRVASTCAASGCQGTRVEALCEGFQCKSSQPIPDDSGCAGHQQDCGAYAPIACEASSDQTSPTCPMRCTQKSDCAAGYACDAQGACVDIVGSGDACSGTGQGTCGDGLKCDHGVCCDQGAGSCCSTPGDCPASYRAAATCTQVGSNSTCQGTRLDATCIAHVCGSQIVQDDSGCAGQVHSCGGFLPIACSTATEQSSPVCATSCSSKTGCASGYTCNASGACVAEATAGQACSIVGSASTCASGLKCDHARCCSASAAGKCCASASDCSNGFDCISNTCATSCAEHSSLGCVASMYCAYGTRCEAKGESGDACSDDDQCLSNVCRSTFLGKECR